MGLMRIDLNFDLYDHNDKSLGSASTALVAGIGNTIVHPHLYKLTGWIEPLKADGCLDLDKADIETLEGFVDTCETMSGFMKGPILDVVKAAKVEAKEARAAEAAAKPEDS